MLLCFHAFPGCMGLIPIEGKEQTQNQTIYVEEREKYDRMVTGIIEAISPRRPESPGAIAQAHDGRAPSHPHALP